MLYNVVTKLAKKSFNIFILALIKVAMADPFPKIVTIGSTHINTSDQHNVLLSDNDHHGWFIRFLYNLMGYMIIILPGAALVFSVKNKLCFPQIQSLTIVRIFVYGKEESHVIDDIELQRDEGDKDHGRDSSSAFDSRRTFKLFYCFLGLQVSFLAWGLLQEKIMTSEYLVHSDQQPKLTEVIKFRDSQFLVFANRVLALIFSMAALVILRNRSTKQSNISYINMSRIYVIAPLYEFSFCSLSNVLSSWCQYEALKYVNFPTQVLSKACKIIPVMLMARFVTGKKYQLFEYGIATSISAGMSLFLWGNHISALAVKGSEGNHPSPPDADSANYSLIDGVVVLGLYLTFDSFTSNWQEKLNKKYKVSSVQMMAAVNCYSILLTLTSLSQQGQLIPSLITISRSKSLMLDCFMLSLCSAAGQLFIFYTISAFGALIFTLIMTLRQSLAIILSCLIYGHPLNALSTVGIVVVFASLFTQIYVKSRK